MKCSEILSLVANLCTIAAFAIAFYVWWTWKDQQNYSFTRDKIFECELVTNKVHTSLMKYINEFYSYKLKDIPSKKPIDPPYYQAIFRNCENEYKPLLNSYDIALSTLFILKIKFSSEILINYKFLENEFDGYINELSKAETTEELIHLYWNSILPKMQDNRKKALEHLEKLRLSV